MRLLAFLQGLFPEIFMWDPTETLPSTRTHNQHAIGIIIQPGPHSPTEYLRLFVTNPEQVANLWGHTALYLRRNGRIVRAFGFDPDRIAMVRDVVPRWLGGWGGAVVSGWRPTTGVYYEERRMFRSPDMIVAEFPIAGHQLYHLEEVLDALPAIGTASAVTHPQHLQLYITRDGANYAHFDPRVMGNCLASIIQILTRANLVLAPQPPNNGAPDYRSRSGRLIGAPDHDVSTSQAQMTALTLQGRAVPNLGIHDLDTGGVLQANFQRRAMVAETRVGRRVGGALATFGAARLGARALATAMAALTPAELVELLSGSAVGDLAVSAGFASFFSAAPAAATYEYACVMKVIIGIAVEGLPADSRLWALPLETLDAILSGLCKCCLMYALAVGDVDAWITAAWILGSFLLALFG